PRVRPRARLARQTSRPAGCSLRQFVGESGHERSRPMSPRRVRADVADAELTVLKALWDGGPGTVRELQERLRGNAAGWAYTTVQTLLGRLLDKGLVRADRRDIAHQFAAT